MDGNKQVSMNGKGSVGCVTPSTLRSSDGLVSALGISATEDGCAPFEMQLYRRRAQSGAPDPLLIRQPNLLASGGGDGAVSA